MVAARDDDDVLGAAGDVDLRAVEEADVAGAQEGPLARVGQAGAEDLLGLLGAAPVPVGDARPGHPDLAHGAVGQRGAGARVDNRHALVGHRGAASDHGPGRSVRRRTLGPARGQRVRCQIPPQRGGVHIAGGDHQGALGQPVGGQMRGGAEAAVGEGRGEALHGLCLLYRSRVSRSFSVTFATARS